MSKKKVNNFFSLSGKISKKDGLVIKEMKNTLPGILKLEEINNIQKYLIDNNYPIIKQSEINSDGNLITKSKYIETYEAPNNDIFINKILKKITELHSLKISKKHNIRRLKVSKEYDYFIKKIKNPWVNNYKDISKVLLKIEKQFCNDQVFCHLDLHKGNILFDKENNLFLIDWDYSAIAHPLFDYCSMIYENNLSNEEIIEISKKIKYRISDIIYICEYMSYYWLAWANLCYEQTNNEHFIYISNQFKNNIKKFSNFFFC